MMTWTEEKERELVEVVESYSNINEGLEAAAEHFKTTFFAVRNRWYSDEVKAIRGVTKPIKEKDVEKIAYEIESKAQILSKFISEEVGTLRDRIAHLERENKETTTAYHTLLKKYTNLEQDFAGLSRIFDRARKLVVEESLGQFDSKTFVMEKNGNLETVENTKGA
jgi:hypothetical protein